MGNKRTMYSPLYSGLAMLITVLLLLTAVPTSSIAAEETYESDRVIVSIGDSYSSGEGIPPFFGEADSVYDEVKNPDWLAHRSKNAWSGMLVLKDTYGNKIVMSEHRDENWYFAAASGAETKHLWEEQSKKYARRESIISPAAIGEDFLEPQLNIFKQVERDGKKADYVTVTLGGNDAGFGKIVEKVVRFSTYLNTSDLAVSLNDVWGRFYEKGGIRDDLKKSYKAICEAAGKQATVLVVGYPQLLDARGFFVSKEEAELVNKAVRDFNDAIEALVKECQSENMNIVFVSVEEAFESHEAYSDNPYINKVMFGMQPEELKEFALASDYSMHPNLEGAKRYRDCVQDMINKLERQKGTPVPPNKPTTSTTTTKPTTTTTTTTTKPTTTTTTTKPTTTTTRPTTTNTAAPITESLKSYEGTWRRTDYDGASLVIFDVEGSHIGVDISVVQVLNGMPGKIATYFIEHVPIVNNQGTFSFMDSHGNTGTCTITLSGGTIAIDCTVDEFAGSYSIKGCAGTYTKTGNIPDGYEPGW